MTSNFQSRRTKFVCLVVGVFLTACQVDSAQSPLLRDTQGRPATMVSVNGTEPVKFVVDTAAQTMAVGGRLIEKLDLQPHPDQTAQLHGAAGVTEVPLYPIASLEVAGATFEDLLAPSLAHKVDTDAFGIVGMSLMTGKRLTFDQLANVIRVKESGRPKSRSGMQSLPIDFIYGTFTRVKVTIDGVEALAVVDTGARRSIANLKMMEALGLTDSTAGLSVKKQAEGVTGHEVNIVIGYESAISLGTETLAAIPLEFSDLSIFGTLQMTSGPAIILGNDALRQLSSFTIDFGEAQFDFTR